VRPDLFEGQEVRVEVETKGTLTRGMSVVDWKGQWGKASNCLVLKEFLGEWKQKNGRNKLVGFTCHIYMGV